MAAKEAEIKLDFVFTSGGVVFVPDASVYGELLQAVPGGI